MNKVEIKSCPLCGSGFFEHYTECRDDYASGEKFQVMKCSDCGFIFTQHFPVSSEIGRYYESEDYISHTDTRKGLMNLVYHWVRSYMLSKKAKLVMHASHLKKGFVLDIGAGTGYFAAEMACRAWKVEAIEKSESARDYANSRFHLDIKGESALKTYSERSFDAVTLWHVMEHLEPLNEIWETLYRILKDNGALVVAVPNCASYDADVYGAMWAAYDVPRHLWHFTPKTMCSMAAKHGFELAECHPMPFDAFYVSMLSEKHSGKSCAFIRGVYTGMKAWLASCGHKERSSSLIYVFTKKKKDEQ